MSDPTEILKSKGNFKQKAEVIWDYCQPDQFAEKEDCVKLIEKVLSSCYNEGKWTEIDQSYG